MEVHPPYLLDNGGDHSGSGVSVTCDVDTAVVEMVVSGQWTRRLALDIYTVLRKCLAEHPAAVIVDLQGLKDRHADSAAMWLAAHRATTGLQPPVQLALAVPASGSLSRRLHWIGISRSVPIFTTVEQARTAVISRRPLTDRLQLTRLAPGPGAAGLARDLIDVASEAWDFPNLRHPGRLVISELVANAVQHAGTPMAVTVWRRQRGLHLSVRDGSPRLPGQPATTPASSRASGGQGLLLVDTLASSWGAMSTRDGKMVWATIRSCRHPSP
ncbi:ATP-binding protein [Actinoplanes sp. CA-051413]|uniref:ATP-binding protein n=1 Tax=Actinoplanes sp. CA-051413 TaxID=3239899 RepID=UPI003D96B9CB